MFFLAMLTMGLAIAKPPPGSQKPSLITPAPPPASLSQPPRQSGSVWNSIQSDVDRSTGFIQDESSYQFGHMQPPPVGKEFQRFMEERERQMRIEQRARQKAGQKLSREELDRREYELFIHAGLSTTSLQTLADEEALTKAKELRNNQLIAAQNDRAAALKDRPNDREQIESTYQKTIQDIRRRYETERERILGYEPPSTTQAAP